MARLLLLRHGQSTWNAEARWQGWADPPLSPLGEAQSRAAAAWLDGAPLGGVVSSDLQRARRTAEIVAEALGSSPVQVEPGLRERDVGDWSSLTAEQIGARWPDALAAWRAGRSRQPPGGEHDDVMTARVLDALSPLLNRQAEALLVVTHGGVIRLLERRLGMQALTVSHLSGRWFKKGPRGLLAGEQMTLPEMGDPNVTAAR